MQEIMTASGRVKSGAHGEILLDLDFSKQMIGDSLPIDQTGKNVFSKVGTGVAAVTSSDGTNCFEFTSGASMFTTGRVIDLSREAVEIRITLLTTVTGASNKMAWCTGDYPSSFVAGICHYAAIGASVPQLFIVDGSRNYSRLQTKEVVGQRNEFVITTDPTKREVKIEEITRGESTVHKPADWFGAGENFSFGGSYVGGVNYAPYSGKIWKLKIQKMR